MLIEYAVQKQFMYSVEIEDVGDTMLKCINLDFEEYYLIVNTYMGKSYILEIGPIQPDFNKLIDGFKVEFKKIDFKEKVLKREISSFINDFKKNISSVEEVANEEEVWNILPNLATQYKNAQNDDQE